MHTHVRFTCRANIDYMYNYNRQTDTLELHVGASHLLSLYMFTVQMFSDAPAEEILQSHTEVQRLKEQRNEENIKAEELAKEAANIANKFVSSHGKRRMWAQ